MLKMLDRYKGLILGIVIIMYLIIMITLERYPEISISELTGILAAIASTTAIAFTILSISNQKKQWLNDSFIKHEAEQLLTFRKMLVSTEESIRFFLDIYLDPFIRYGFIEHNKHPQIKYLDLSFHFNALIELNDFYNANQHIFRKYSLEHKIECISLILESSKCLPERDINYEFITEDNSVWIYRIEEEVLKVIMLFNDMAHMHFDVNPSKPESLEEMNAFLQKDRFEELKRLRVLTAQSLSSLSFEIDKLTTFSDDILPQSFYSYRKRFFTKKSPPTEQVMKDTNTL